MSICHVISIFCVVLHFSNAFLSFEGNKVYLFNIVSDYRLQQKNPIRDINEGTSAFLAIRAKSGDLLYSFKGSPESKLDRKEIKSVNVATKEYQKNLEDNALALLNYELRSYRKYFLRADVPEVIYKKIRLPMGTCNATIVIQKRTHLTTIIATASAKNCMISRKFMLDLRVGHTAHTVIDDIQNELNIEFSNTEQQIKELKLTSFVDTHVRETKIHTVRKVALKYVGSVMGVTDWEQNLLMTALSAKDKPRRG